MVPKPKPKKNEVTESLTKFLIIIGTRVVVWLIQNFFIIEFAAPVTR